MYKIVILMFLPFAQLNENDALTVTHLDGKILEFKTSVGFYSYNDLDAEVCEFVRTQLTSILDHKYGLGEVWAKHYAQTIVDEAAEVMLDLSREVAEQMEKDDE